MYDCNTPVCEVLRLEGTVYPCTLGRPLGAHVGWDGGATLFSYVCMYVHMCGVYLCTKLAITTMHTEALHI